MALFLQLRADVLVYQDTSLLVPVAADGHPVNGWKERSGTSNYQFIAPSGNHATWKLNQLNGRPCVRTDGVNIPLRRNGNHIVPKMIIAVFRSPVVGNWAGYAGPLNDGVAAAGAQYLYTNVGATSLGNNAGAGAVVYVNGVATAAFAPINTAKIVSITMPNATQVVHFEVGFLAGNTPAPLDLFEIRAYDAVDDVLRITEEVALAAYWFPPAGAPGATAYRIQQQNGLVTL